MLENMSGSEVHYYASEGFIYFIRPILFMDVNIKYEDKWYWGWYEGEELWRIFWGDEKNLYDKYIVTEKVQEWYYLNSL